MPMNLSLINRLLLNSSQFDAAFDPSRLIRLTTENVASFDVKVVKLLQQGNAILT